MLTWQLPVPGVSYLKSQSPFQQFEDVSRVWDKQMKFLLLPHVCDTSLLEYNPCENRDSATFRLMNPLGLPQCPAQGGNPTWFLEWSSVWLWIDNQRISPHLSLCPIFWPLPQFAICLLHTFLYTKCLYTRLIWLWLWSRPGSCSVGFD